MTDRFYPLGLPAEADVWKTSYEVQNEMRAFARSPFPPGTAVHLPGARDKFGFGSPGPLAHRLAKPETALTEDVDLPNPRETLAIPRVQEADERVTFHTHDVDEMVRSYRSPVVNATMTGSKGFGIKKSRSVPSLARTTAPPRISEPPAAVSGLEDEHFSYFLPKGQQRDGRDKINPHTMSKLSKTDRISFPFSGEGTGFRSQGTQSGWMPGGSYQNQPTTYRTSFTKQPFYRKSPVSGY